MSEIALGKLRILQSRRCKVSIFKVIAIMMEGFGLKSLKCYYAFGIIFHWNLFIYFFEAEIIHSSSRTQSFSMPSSSNFMRERAGMNITLTESGDLSKLFAGEAAPLDDLRPSKMSFRRWNDGTSDRVMSLKLLILH